MASITTRAGKGSPLTHNEVDANFTNLNTALTWQQIASSTPTGTGTVTFSSIPATYADLLVVFDGISTAGSAEVLEVYASGDNGSTWTDNPIAFVAADYGASAYYGSVFIPYYLGNAGFVYGGAGRPASDPGANDADTSYPLVWRISGGIDAIKVQTDSANFDAGTIRLMGR